jgi:translocation and assembly module TamB
MDITGDIRINKARYREAVEWRTWLLTAKAIEKPKSEMSVFEKAELNIRLSGSENITVDNNIARGPIRIRDMIIKGTVSNPILFGRLESNDGYIYFRNNEFRIIHASADFTDPHRIKPILNLTAETSMKGYTIRLNLEGETDRFNLSLSSDPPLEEVDILSLLTVGQLGKQTKGLEGGIGAGTATSFITGKQQDIIEERVRALTGIDRFQVEPYVSKLTGTVEPRVTVSERLIGDKVFVTYTTSIGSTEEQILKVEYLLDRNISLIGTRDERGSVGGDVKFRFEFK